MHLAATLRTHQRPSPIVEPSGRTMRLHTSRYDDRRLLEQVANRMNELNQVWPPSSNVRNIWVAGR